MSRSCRPRGQPPSYSAAANYSDHAQEMRAKVDRKRRARCSPGAAGVGAGQRQEVSAPTGRAADWEVELAWSSAGGVPGRCGRSRTVIGRYTGARPVPLRDSPAATDTPFLPDWLAMKSTRADMPLGPGDRAGRLRTRSDDLDMSLSVPRRAAAGVEHQEHIFPSSSRFAYLSRIVALKPGDLVLTGNAAGSERTRTISCHRMSRGGEKKVEGWGA